MLSPSELALIGVLSLAVLHALAGHIHGDELDRPSWLSVASGLSVAYVFVHLLPELAETQAQWLEARPHRTFGWLEHQVYLSALIGVLLALALYRATVGRRDGGTRFWLHLGGFALYNMLLGGFALRLHSVLQLVLAVVAFGGHFLVNDHSLHVQYGRAYERYGRWVLAGSLVLGWVIAVVARPSMVLVATMLGLISGAIILNVIKDEVPAGKQRRTAPFTIAAIVYAALLLALTYTARIS